MLCTKQDENLEFMSIGMYSGSWLNDSYYSAQGLSPEKWLAIPKAKMNLLPIKDLFPSLDTVMVLRESRLDILWIRD